MNYDDRISNLLLIIWHFLLKLLITKYFHFSLPSYSSNYFSSSRMIACVWCCMSFDFHWKLICLNRILVSLLIKSIHCFQVSERLNVIRQMRHISGSAVFLLLITSLSWSIEVWCNLFLSLWWDFFQHFLLDVCSVSS